MAGELNGEFLQKLNDKFNEMNNLLVSSKKNTDKLWSTFKEAPKEQLESFIQQIRALDRKKAASLDLLLRFTDENGNPINNKEQLQKKVENLTSAIDAGKKSYMAGSIRLTSRQQMVDQLAEWKGLLKVSTMSSEEQMNILAKAVSLANREYEKQLKLKKDISNSDSKDHAAQTPQQAALQKQQEAYRKILNIQQEIQRTKNRQTERKASGLVVDKSVVDAEVAQIKRLEKEIRALKRERATLAKESGVSNTTKLSKGDYAQSLDYQRQLTKETVRHGEALARLKRQQKQVKDNFENMLPTLQRLASAFGVAFSVRGLVNFGRKLIETRGEFEMQFVAMKQIIGDVDAATKIWNQTMQQALQSPFRAMQLVDYTKKLAAYRIETDKLFDTTKRLADVSAGLGVDMGRLILAYGQVKTANFLRASEVRQFTEAGVNIYDNLAKYFSEIEGRAVSTAEVVERVTKRMVLFSDVEAIFKRMTDEGGTFYNMQEVQADTVRGQIMKLHDAYDQMLNTIGQANQGTLRDLVEIANRMVRNWRDVVAFLKMQIPVFATTIPYWYSMKKVMKMSGEEMAALSRRVTLMRNDIVKLATSTKASTKAFGLWRTQMALSITQSAAFEKGLQTLIITGKALKTVFRSMVPFLLIEALFGAVNAITSTTRKAKELKKELRDISEGQQDRGTEEVSGYKKLQESLKQTNVSSIERAKIIQQLNDKYGVYLDKLFDENSSLQDVADGYERVAERAREAARARALEEGGSKIVGKYNQERNDWIYNMTKHPNLASGGFGIAGKFLVGGTIFSISKKDANDFSEYVDTIVSKNFELYESMSQTDRQKAIIEMYKDYFGEELPSAASRIFNFIDNTVDRIRSLKDFEESLTQDFDLTGLSKKQRETILNLRDEANKTIEELDKAAPHSMIQMPMGIEFEVKRTDSEVSDILAYIKNKIRDKAKEEEVDIRLSMGTIGLEEAKNLKGKIGKLADPLAQQINERIIEEIKQHYGVHGDIWDYIIGNPWDNKMNEMVHAINSSLLTTNDIQQGIGKSVSYVEGRLQGQLSVLAEINKKKNSGLITDEKQLKALESQKLSVETTYRWLQRTLFLLKEKAEVSEVKDALLSNETIKKAQDKVKKKYGEDVATQITIGASFDYANIDKTQSAVAKVYHDAGDAIDKEIKSIKASANADKDKIKILEKQRDIQYALADAYGYVDEKAKKTGQKESISQMISLLKEMNSEYDKLSKTAYGYAESNRIVRDSYLDAFKAIFKAKPGSKGAFELDKAFTMIDWNNIDITNKRGVAQALKNLEKYLTDNKLWANYSKEAQEQLKKAYSSYDTEADVDVQVHIREDFAKEMEKMFSDYELTIDLQKLNLPADAAKELLGFDYTSLNALLERAKKFRADLENTEVVDEEGNVTIKNYFSEDDQKVYEGWMKKVEDKIFEMRKEKAKQYTKYLEHELSERAKLEMQYVQDVAFVETHFKDEQRESIKKNLEDDYKQALKDFEWKSFKESDFYVEMMQDLTSMPSEYLDIMMKKLDEWAKKADVLSPKALKEVLRAREKIIEAQVAMSPIRALGTSLSGIREFQNSFRVDKEGNAIPISKDIKESQKQLEGFISTRAESIEKTKAELALEEAKLGAIKAQEEIQNKLNLLSNKGVGGLSMTGDVEADLRNIDALIDKNKEWKNELLKGGELTKNVGESEAAFTERKGQFENSKREIENIIALLIELRQLRVNAAAAGVDPTQNISASKAGTFKNIRKLRTELDELEKAQASDEDSLAKYKEWNKAVYGLVDNIKTVRGHVKELGNSLYETFDALGAETDEVTDAWREFGNSFFDTITQSLEMLPALITGMTAAGTAINAAMGIIGLIAEAIQLVLLLIRGLSKVNDAYHDRKIRQLQESIDELGRAYNRLGKQMEKAWDSVSYIDNYEKSIENIHQQIEALESQRYAESNKKKSDAAAIREYDNAIEDAEEQLEELRQKQIEVFGGIGEDNYRSAAEGFVNAWKAAFLETGDGLQGLKDHFDEFLQDWFTKQATMLIARKYLDNIFKQIDDAVVSNSNGGVEVMWNEIQNIIEAATKDFPALSAKLEEAFKRFGGFSEGNLSGLAAGIQGMTEEQANILEAYWNSVRQLTSSIDVNVAYIASVMASRSEQNNALADPLVRLSNNLQMAEPLFRQLSDVINNKKGDDNVVGVIEPYLSGIMASASDLDNRFIKMTEQLLNNNKELYNPMLQQLQVIAAETRAAHLLLQSATKSGHPQGGYGFKVFND